jgi:protein phosphatase PTC2/3
MNYRLKYIIISFFYLSIFLFVFKKVNKEYNIIETSKDTVFSIKGKRDYMEDTYCIYKTSKYTIYGVFDGHGGKQVSDILKYLIPNYLSEYVFNDSDVEENITHKIKRAFINIEAIIRKNVKPNSVGSTACIIVNYNNTLYTINLGDSRAVILQTDATDSTTIVLETKDHKPDNEKKRISKNKGYVKFDGQTHRVNGNLALSRAFGDFYLKYNNIDGFYGPVSIEPDIYVTPMLDNYKYALIIASDGLWDVFTSENVLSIYNRSKEESIDNISRLIGSSAYKKGSTDNITVLTSQL